MPVQILARKVLRFGLLDQRVEAIERAVALDPRYRASRYALGLAYRGLGLLDQAQRELALGLDAQTRYLADPLSSQVAAYSVNLPALRNQAGVES